MKIEETEKTMIKLKAKVSKLLSKVSESMKLAIEALEELNQEKALKVLDMDCEIDDLNRTIDKLVCEAIGENEWSMKDLRYLITMVKFAGNLERIGDLSCNIAEKLIYMIERGMRFELGVYLKEMFGLSMEMVHRSFKAFAGGDVNLAVETWRMDEKVDRLEMELRNYAKKLEDSELIIMLVLLARDAERIADHACNLCEEIVFIETGMDMEDFLGGDHRGGCSDSRGRS